MRDVVPPEPAKLADQARRVVDGHGGPAARRARRRARPARRAGRARRRPSTTCCPAAAPVREVPGAQRVLSRRAPGRGRLDAAGLRAVAADPPPLLRRRRADRRLLPEGAASPGPDRRSRCSPSAACRRSTSRPGTGWASVPWGSSLEQVRERAARARGAGGPGVATRLTTLALYGHLWGTAETGRAVRRAGDAAALARHPGRAGPRPGAAGHRPGRHRRPASPSLPGSRRSTWTSSPSRPARRRTRRWA